MWRAYERAVENGADSWTQFELWVDGFFNNNIFDLFVNQTYSVMTNEVLTAVPLFLFMGYIVERANIVARLFTTLNIAAGRIPGARSEEHTSELQSLMRISYAVFCLKKQTTTATSRT